jgi:hypothetical protein
MSRATLSFPMVAAAAGQMPHPGVQVVSAGDPSELEGEFQYADVAIRGGLGTTGDGVLATEGTRLWIHAIAAGPLQQERTGRGEVVSGVLLGYLALGTADGDEGSLGSCTATDHSFSLRAQ